MTRPRSHGFALMDIMMTLALVSIVLTMAVMLLDRVWKTERQLIENDRTARASGQWMALLSRDVRRAQAVEIHPDRLTLDGQTTWTLGPDKVERRRDGQTSHWTPSQRELYFEAAPFGLVLAGNEMKVPMANTLQWARQAVTR